MTLSVVLAALFNVLVSCCAPNAIATRASSPGASSAAMEWQQCGPGKNAFCASAKSIGRRSVLAYFPADAQMVFIGQIGPDFDKHLESAIIGFPDAKRLAIRSGGGMARPARLAAAVANRHKLPVQVRGYCISACALFWASVDAREISVDSTVGLHTNRLGGLFPTQVEDLFVALNNRKAIAILRSAGFPEDAIERGVATPSSKVFWIDALALKRAGVVRAVVGGAPSTVPAYLPGRPMSYPVATNDALEKLGRDMLANCRSTDNEVQTACTEKMESAMRACKSDQPSALFDREQWKIVASQLLACIMPRPICRGVEVASDAELRAACGAKN